MNSEHCLYFRDNTGQCSTNFNYLIMRKSNLIFSGIIALSLSFAGCSSEEFDAPQSSPNAGMPVSFSAAYDSETKKIVYGGYADNQTELNWVVDDKVVIYSPSSKDGASVSQQGIYTAKNGGQSTDFDYLETGGYQSITWADASTQSFYSLYPGDTENASFADGQLSITIPKAPNYAISGTDGMENVLLYAIAPNASTLEEYIPLNYKHIPTVLEVQFPDNTKTITGIEVTATDGQPVAGTFSAMVGTTNTSNPIDVAFWDAQPTVGQAERIALIPPTDFKNGKLYIAIAPYSFAGLNITFRAEGYTATISNTASITPRKLYKVTKAGDLNWEDNSVEESAAKVDLGMLVKTKVVNGAVMTRVVGYLDGANSLAWVVCDDEESEENTAKLLAGAVTLEDQLTGNDAITALEGATPLYFANGNLLISTGEDGEEIGTGYIKPVGIDTYLGTNETSDGYGQNTLNEGLFRYSIVSGEWTDDDLTLINISGNPTYDIATAKLGSDWRLPTALEWAFLVEEIATTTKTETTEPIGGRPHAEWSEMPGNAAYTRGYYFGAWQNNSNFQGYLIVSKVNGGKILLPATGIRRYHEYFELRGEAAFYWSGTFAGTLSNLARSFSFDHYNWSVSRYVPRYAFAIRPVSE